MPSRTHLPLGLILLLSGLTAFGPLSVDMYLPALPEMGRDLRAPVAGAFTVASFYVGLCLGQLLHGPLSDRVGRRPPLIGGIALYVVASAGAALAVSIDMLIVMRFLQAFGGCAGVVIGRAVVRDRYEPNESAQVFSLLLLVMSIAPVIAPLLGSFVLLVAGWRAIFWILTGFGALIWLGTLLGLPETRSAETEAHARGEPPHRSYLAILGEPRVMSYALAAGCSHMGLLTYLAIAPEVLISGFHVSAQHFGALIAVNGLGLVAANYLNRHLLRRWDYDRILRGANLASIACALILFATARSGFGGLWGVAMPLFFLMALVGCSQPNAFAGAMAHDRRRAGATSALIGFLQFGLGALGSTLASAFHDGTALPMAIVILVAHLGAGLSLHAIGRGLDKG